VKNLALTSAQVRPLISTFPSSVNCPSAQLPLGDGLEPGALEEVGFDTPLRGGPLGEQSLEHAPRYPDHAAVLADLDSIDSSLRVVAR
jgi:hypothetical protein